MTHMTPGSTDPVLRQYFDRQAPAWDRRVTGEALECLESVVRDLRIAAGSRLLDIGSGTGVLLPMLLRDAGPDGLVVELDISGEMARTALSKGVEGPVAFLQADVHAIPVAAGAFDMVICNNALPHFSAKPVAIAEMSRVLRSGGRLAICHTMSREAVNRLHHTVGGVVGSHVLPGDDDLRRWLAAAGLVDVSLEDSSRRFLLVARKQ